MTKTLKMTAAAVLASMEHAVTVRADGHQVLSAHSFVKFEFGEQL